MIKSAIQWAKSLGYGLVEHNLGTKTGADAIFQNAKGQKLILEVVTGARFKILFSNARIKEALAKVSKYWVSPPEILGLIVVGDRIDSIRKHGTKAGLPDELFNPPTQTVFPVLARDFESCSSVVSLNPRNKRKRLRQH